MTFFRATLAELVAPFLMTLGVTSFVLLMGKIYNLINLMVERHVALAEGALMFLFLLPQSVTVMLPIGVLGAVMITVIRQCTDSEVMALRVSGLSLWRYSAPLAVFGLIGVALTAVMTVWVQPAANTRFLDLQVKIIREHAEENIVPGELNFDFGDKVIRIGQRLENKEVRSVFLADREFRPGSPFVVADRGTILVDQARHRVVFRLEDGWMYTEDPDPRILNAAQFETLDYVLAISGKGHVDTREVAERWSYPTGELPERIRGARTRLQRSRLTMELVERFVIPWSALAFSLAAFPLALHNPRSGRTGGIIRAVALVIGYYILWIGVRDLVLTQKAPALVLIFPSVAIGMLGLLRIGQLNSRS
jgi:lipopolysaccharide export system permease protein